MEKIKLSAVVLAKNEEINISDCIASLSFCNEIIVIDDNSTDKTGEIAKKMGAKVLKRDLANDFSDQHNYGLRQAKNEWVLFIDADERVSNNLAREIVDSVSLLGMENIFSFKRRDFMWGEWLNWGEIGSFRGIRLVKKGSGRWKRRVHEYFESNKKVVQLKNPIDHFPHQNLDKFVANINIWSSWHAKANMDEGKKSTLFKIVAYPIGHFVKNFVFRLGFLDGLRGLVVSLLMAGHSFLSWSKLYLLQRETIQSVK